MSFFQSDTFSYEKCTAGDAKTGVNDIKLFDFVWLQIFAHLTGGNIRAQNNEFLFAEYPDPKNSNNVLLIFANQNQLQVYEHPVRAMYPPGTRFFAAHVRGYESLFPLHGSLEKATKLPFYKGKSEVDRLDILPDRKLRDVNISFFFN